MVISKDKAKVVARSLCEKKLKYIETLTEKFAALVLAEYKKQIPDAVSKAFSNHPEWFYTTDVIRLDSHGFSREYVYVNSNVICNKGTDSELKLTRESSSILYKKFSFIEKQRGEHKKLVGETISSLLALKTFKSIKDKFPEAAELLPEQYPVPATIDVSGLRNKLANQIPNK
jgi:hypothetical protein